MSEQTRMITAIEDIDPDCAGHDEVEIFGRVHKQTGEMVEGPWEMICDHDKRLWSDPQLLRTDCYVFDVEEPGSRFFTDSYEETGGFPVLVPVRTPGKPAVFMQINITTFELTPHVSQVRYPCRAIAIYASYYERLHRTRAVEQLQLWPKPEQWML